jgi:alkanesulfonate monooxygenase SsuD/methylene tetrahydromethanopterin reductase-like flavin-dependent oxidoreductase (luciferase family)
MAITLDEVSGGRVILGIGAGWHKPEFDAFGLDFTHKVDQFEEQVQIIAPLITEGRVDFQGKYHSANDCLMLPAPARRIPLLIAGKQPRMLRLVARYADAYNTAWFGHADTIGERVASVRQACEAEGRDPATLSLTVGVNVAFPALADPPEGADDPAKFITGSVEDVAAAFRAYAMSNVDHLNVVVHPFTVDGMRLLGQAAQLARPK